MDVVYIVKPGEKNESLRYSLRSLTNFGHDTVWVAGYKPSWVDEVGHIPTAQHRDKHANSTLNVRATCESGEVSDPFVLFNDDFFIVAPDQQAPAWHRGRMADLLRHPKMAGRWRSGAAETAQRLAELGYADPYSYELHVPMVVDKQAMLRALDLGRDIQALHKRTLYGNLAGLGGVEHPDVKVDGSALPDDSWPLWSTTDGSFRHCRVGDLIRARFPAPSPYEVADLADTDTQKGAVMPYYVNTRTGAMSKAADPADIPNRKAAMHARRTIERMDRSRRWRRATDEEIEAAGRKPAKSAPAKKSAAKKAPAKKSAEPVATAEPVGGDESPGNLDSQ